jgi:hypothetical protein
MSVPHSHSRSGILLFDQLDGKLFAAFGSASFENVSSALGAHAGSKAVDSLTAPLFGLPSSFRHDGFSSISRLRPIWADNDDLIRNNNKA